MAAPVSLCAACDRSPSLGHQEGPGGRARGRFRLHTWRWVGRGRPESASPERLGVSGPTRGGAALRLRTARPQAVLCTVLLSWRPELWSIPSSCVFFLTALLHI